MPLKLHELYNSPHAVRAVKISEASTSWTCSYGRETRNPRTSLARKPLSFCRWWQSLG